MDVKLSKSVELLRFLSRFHLCDRAPVEAEVNRGPSAESISDLLVWEGRAAVAYWVEFGRVVNRLWPEARFVTRKGKSWAPSATDPVNPLLNFGYSFLEGRVLHAANSVGLESSIGWLHETAASKLPVVYDLQEPFRWLVDLSVIETIAGRQLDRKGDFITTENYHIRLRPHAIGFLSERLSENFNRAVPFGGQRRTYDSILFETARKLARHLHSRSKRLDLGFPFDAFDGAIDRDAADTISALTYAEARKVGISKAGLWDMKRRAEEGKPLRVYAKVARKLADANPSK